MSPKFSSFLIVQFEVVTDIFYTSRSDRVLFSTKKYIADIIAMTEKKRNTESQNRYDPIQNDNFLMCLTTRFLPSLQQIDSRFKYRHLWQNNLKPTMIHHPMFWVKLIVYSRTFFIHLSLHSSGSNSSVAFKKQLNRRDSLCLSYTLVSECGN